MMKFYATPIAVAVALAVCPFAAQADSGFYGSVRIGLQHADPGGDADASTNFRNYASRAGFAGETELDNGLTAFGKLEFGVDTGSSANDNGALSTRQAYIGLKGDFGNVLIGQAYHTWYNTVIGPVDQPWWNSCNGCISYTGRSENGLTYTGNFGAVTAGATVYMVGGDPENNELDGFEIGASFAAGPVNIGVGIQDLDNGTEPTLGIAASGSSGAIGYAANLTSQSAPSGGGEDATGIDVYLSYGNAYIDIGTIDQGDASTGFTLGYTYPIGENTTSWYELNSFDSGVDGSDASLTLRAALKYDWK